MGPVIRTYSVSSRQEPVRPCLLHFSANEEAHTAPDIFVEPSPKDIINYVQALTAGEVFTEPDPEYDTVLRECLKLALEETKGE